MDGGDDAACLGRADGARLRARGASEGADAAFPWPAYLVRLDGRTAIAA
jgi:hypothetical protein